MAHYVFRCLTCKDGEGKPQTFSIFLSSIPKKIVQATECSDCGKQAKRAFDLEIPTQAAVGITPISKSTTTPGSIYNTVRRAFGDHDEQDPSKAPFRDSGELKAFLNGKNDLGKPSIDQRTGKPRRRPDGSIIRDGAKLIQYDRNATPSRDDVRKKRPSRSASWRGGDGKFETGAGDGMRITS